MMVSPEGLIRLAQRILQYIISARLLLQGTRFFYIIF